MRLLVVEDEQVLADTIAEVFKRENYIVDAIYDGYDGYNEALTDIYDAIILDVMLPSMNGFEIIKKLREEGITTPTIMLTAKSELDDKVTGLDLDKIRSLR
jgi:DNA-binding response OmpR family regulator